MAPAIVLRWEDETGRGPFTSRKKAPGHMLNLCKLRGAELELGDTGIYRTMYEVLFCGLTVDQWRELSRPQDIKALQANGFRCKKYLCPPGTVYILPTQVVFEKSRALPLRRKG